MGEKYSFVRFLEKALSYFPSRGLIWRGHPMSQHGKKMRGKTMWSPILSFFSDETPKSLFYKEFFTQESTQKQIHFMFFILSEI
jgi:hypothetical protein